MLGRGCSLITAFEPAHAVRAEIPTVHRRVFDRESEESFAERMREDPTLVP
jgi:hypothetical protein